MAAQVVPQGSGGGAQYGYNPAIQTANPGFTQTMYKAEFDYYFCAFCCGDYASCCVDRSRKYFVVLENGYEDNNPTGCTLCCCAVDMVHKSYFDRGIYNQQGCLRGLGILSGAPSVHANNVKHICCCVDCPDGCNDCLACYWPSLCGDRIRYLPFQTYCCCCPMRACACNNCLGLCGPKNGEPLILLNFLGSLRVGSAPALEQAMESSRAGWKARTGLP